MTANKVKHKVPPITECNFCGGEVKYVNNREIYGRSFGDWPYAYRCTCCDAYVGVHPNTTIPLGTLADHPTRNARKVHKQHFINMTKKLNWSRSQAYRWLSEQLELAPQLTHWGMFDFDTCVKAGAVCKEKVLAHLSPR